MMSSEVADLSIIGVDALKEMREYVIMHFTFEETYMKEIGYPDLLQHISTHRAFDLVLEKMNSDFKKGISQLNSEIMKIIENWLVHHILVEDQKYKAFYLSN